jgi:CRISPR/Cas system-associated exonuclease Cas4 (RecB family)
MRNDGRVSASEIGEYVYCKRAWYLRSKGLLETTPQMQRGIMKHHQVFLRIEFMATGRKIAFILLSLGLIFALLTVLKLL